MMQCIANLPRRLRDDFQHQGSPRRWPCAPVPDSPLRGYLQGPRGHRAHPQAHRRGEGRTQALPETRQRMHAACL